MLEVRYIYDVDNQPVNEYTIKNGKYQLSAINMGASLTKIIVPNRSDKLENITLRYFDYKAYKTNSYYLGCLIDTNKFINHEPCALNYYFDCTFEYNTLKFTYQKNNNYIYVKYSLLENKVLIVYETNLLINLSNVLFFNLSGNVKDNIFTHKLEIASKKIDVKEEISYFKHYSNVTNEALLKLQLKENGIEVTIDSINRDIYLSFGEYFNKEFFINKRNLAQSYSGIGIVVGGNLPNQTVSYEFLE